MEQEKKTKDCCIATTNKDLGKNYWDNQYKINETGWDLGEVSPPLKNYINQLTDKNIRILIPGCGNTYEAEYLLENGFSNIFVIDISPLLVGRLKERFQHNTNIKIVLGDFFEHKGEYDLILEQTFFCALNPALRTEYAKKMYMLLDNGGKLAGLLFNKEFEKEGPPFGGTKCSYEKLFEPYFEFKSFNNCYNSFPKRKDSELFIILRKKTVV